MKKIDISYENKIDWMIYASIMSLCLGLFTSMTFLALNHIFIMIPILFFISQNKMVKWSKSQWFLFAMIIAIIMSVLFNQDIANDGYKPLSKVKYYLIALLSITPMCYYFINLKKQPDHDKKIKWLLWALIGTTTLASISGMCGVYLGYNFLLLKKMATWRNGGLFGMLMNYSHNMSFFLIIVFGLILYREDVKKYIDKRLLYISFLINLVGLYTTFTRGAWLSFLVALPFFFFKKNLKLFLISLFSLAIIGFGAYKIAGSLVVRPDSESERMSQWEAAVAGFRERPVLGLGYLNFEKMSIPLKKKYNLKAQYFGGHAHSNYFEMLASTGLIGFTFFMLWQIFWFLEMLKRDDLIGKVAIPFIVVFVVSGLTQSTFTLGANLFFIMPAYAISQIYLVDKSSLLKD